AGVRHTREAVMRGERDVDDRAAAVSEGAVRDEPAHALSPADVQPRHGAPALWLDRLRGREVLAAGVVDQDVDVTVALERERDDALSVLELADVACDVARAELVRRLGEDVFPP